jgi:hypothetical protein
MLLQHLYKFSFLLLVIFFTQYKLFAQPKIIWQKCLGSSGSDAFGDIITLKDKTGYLASVFFRNNDGDAADAPFAAASCLIKYDASFNIISKKYYGGLGSSLGLVKLIELKDQSIICTGSVFGSTGDCVENHGGTDLFLMKLDEQGNKLWAHCYGSVGTEEFSDMISTPDGGYLLLGYSNFSGGNIPFHYSDSHTTDGILIKVDSLGNHQWTKVFGGSNYDMPLKIAEQKKNQYRIDIGTSSKDYDLSTCTVDTLNIIWSIIVDSSGKIIKQKFVSAYEDITYIGQLIKTGENEITLVGSGNSKSKYNTTFPIHDEIEGAIARYDTNLNLISLKQWGGSKVDGFYSMIRDKNGFYYFIGNTGSTNGNIYTPIGGSEDFWILCTDENLNEIWSQTFGGTSKFGEIPLGYDKILLKDNLLLFFGHVISAPTLPDKDLTCGNFYNSKDPQLGDAWLVAFDLNTAIDANRKGSYSIYPNPTNNYLTIRNTQPTFKNTIVRITDLGGKLLLQTNINDEIEQNITTDFLSDGLYIVSVIKQKKVVYSSKFFIKH